MLYSCSMEVGHTGVILCPVCWSDIEGMGGDEYSALISACQTLGQHMTAEHGLTYEDVGHWLKGVLRPRTGGYLAR